MIHHVFAIDSVPAPLLDSHVFCRVKQNRGNVSIDECVSWPIQCICLLFNLVPSQR